jgi:1-acyl-sn-glycerol-3-phosphate acyltransferase
MQLFAVGFVFWAGGSAVFAVVPALVKEVYGYADYQVIGFFRSFMGLGLLTGAIVFTLLGSALRSEIAITWSLLGAGGLSLVLTGTAFVGWPGRVLIVIGAVCTVGMGACGTGIVASYNALLQRMVPNRYRGRVFGLLDLWTTFGLLLATGLLGIPQWSGIDRWVGYILLAMALLFLGAGLLTLMVRLRSSPYRWPVALYVNLNEFLARFWYRLRRDGPCTIPRTGSVIIVANHTCSADPLMLLAACRYRLFSFMIAREYSNVPFFRYFTRLIECIPVRRDGRDTEATKAAIRHLRAGKALGIFIEGRLPKPGEVAEPKDGPALLALRTGATVIPAHISGTRYHDAVSRSFFCRHRVRVRFGRPVDLSPFAGNGGRSTISAATRTIHAAILSLAP